MVDCLGLSLWHLAQVIPALLEETLVTRCTVSVIFYPNKVTERSKFGKTEIAREEIARRQYF